MQRKLSCLVVKLKKKKKKSGFFLDTGRGQRADTRLWAQELGLGYRPGSSGPHARSPTKAVIRAVAHTGFPAGLPAPPRKQSQSAL